MRDKLKKHRQTLEKLSPTRLWVIGALCTILLFVFLRVWRLDIPSEAFFDEVYSPKIASQYLSGEQIVHAHPLLGVLIIALGELVLGDTPLGWRVTPLITGVGLIGVGYWAGKEIFNDRRVGLLMAFLLSIEGIFIVYSRTGLIDGFMLLFGLAALGFCWQFRKKRLAGKGAWRYLLLAGLFAGLAIAIKWIGLGFLALVTVTTFLTLLTNKERSAGIADFLIWLISFVVVPAITYILPFAIVWHTDFWAQFIEWHRQTWEYHTDYVTTQTAHPYSSEWWSWPLLLRPVGFYYENIGNQVVVVHGIGNPFVWWLSTVTLLYSVMVILYSLIAWRQPVNQIISREELAPVVYLVAAWAVFYLPWALVGRDLFLYHYMASYLCALLLTGYWLGQALRTKYGRIITIVTLLTATLVGLAFAPIWIAYPISHEWYSYLMWFSSWI